MKEIDDAVTCEQLITWQVAVSISIDMELPGHMLGVDRKVGSLCIIRIYLHQKCCTSARPWSSKRARDFNMRSSICAGAMRRCREMTLEGTPSKG